MPADPAAFDELVLARAQQQGGNFYAREIRDALGGQTTVQAVTASLMRLQARGLVAYESAHPANPPRRREEATWWPREVWDADTEAMRRAVGRS